MPNTGTITVTGGTAAEQARVQKAANEVILRLWQVTDGHLRECIKNKAIGGKVFIEQCDDPYLMGYNEWREIIGFKLWASDEIHLCMNNIGADDDLLVNVMMHEWAHSCCWIEGDDDGVPGNDGFF